MGPENLDECVKDATLVLIPAGMPRKPGNLLQIVEAETLQHL